MMLLAFIPSLLVFLLSLLTSSKRFITVLSIVLASLSVICLIIDSHIYDMFKFHINSTILAFIFSNQWREVFDLTEYELLLMSMIILAVLIVEIIVAWVVWKKLIPSGRFKIGNTIIVCWLGGTLFSYFTLMLSIDQNNNLFSQQTPNLPLFTQFFAYTIPMSNAEDILRRYSEQKFSQPFFPNDPLQYPLHPMQCHAPKTPYNIILIMVDSLRFDSVKPPYMPNVAEFGKKGWQFQKHLSGGNATQPGLFSLFYSIPSNYWTAAIKQEKTPIFMDLLLQHGYETKVIWSAEMYNPPFYKTIYAKIKDLPLNGAPGSDIGDWDRHTTQKGLAFLDAYNKKQPFYLHLFYNAPHAFCSEQSFPAVFQPAHKNCSRMTMTSTTDPLPYHNRYLNSAKFIDDEVGKILEKIEEKGYLENSIVIFTADHGQEFNDSQQNYWGHASNFTDTQVHVPLLIYWPKEKPNTINYLTNGYDVVPTLLTRFFKCKNPPEDYSIGQSLLIEEGRLPFVLAGSYINMGIIEPDRLTTLETSGRVTITDKRAVPILGAEPRMDVVNQALKLMRKYFHKKSITELSTL